MLLRTEKLSKSFNGVYALSNINFEVEAGEVHGLVGENGAGKSTLIKMLTGVYSIDEGTVFWEDQPVKIPNPSQSRTLGINVVHQDRTLIPTFDGVENAYLGREYPHKGMQVDWKTMWETVEKTRDELGIELDLSKMAIELSPPQKTCLEIIRAMMNDCKLLILDEPTASLTDKESEILFDIIGKLKKKGTSVLYVSHRMDEIFRLTDRITVFKNGSMVSCVKTSEVDKDKLVSMMTDEWKGSDIVHNTNFGKVLLEVQGIRTKDGVMKKGSLKVREKEILGVFGLGGSGRTELLEGIYGYRPITEGTVTIDGEQQNMLSPANSIKKGMVLISEDRRGKALVGNLSIKENVLLSCIDRYAKHGYLDEKKEKQDVSEKAEALKIRMTGLDQRIIELSGGNQQKAVFAKALMTNPKVFLCDEPTQAVDIMTRNEIHKLLREKADAGNAVVYVSSDLKEILEVADTIQLVVQGETRQLLVNENLTTTEVLSYCYE
ncbi:sugar ABC transporter ATP-binding protein [Clostridiales bacterium AM23-16LB]|nr:sugar ABC transporter ATP-binding protein [Clostridiales bacterium AM23-16LB]RHR44927.1 sugar ABC transporter ATP-binding protein [Clostridiaceae bacterium AF18-31LB]RHW05107.1 sugar ABC transporter ATP-binding protein [Clostridiaceae bacterium OF09-1]